jgi:membrane associated rhomboid family serine protease
MGVLGGEQGGVAYGAHIGGFIAGAVIALPLKSLLDRRA